MDKDYAVGIIMDISNNILTPVKEELLRFIKGPTWDINSLLNITQKNGK